ncbi:MAG: DUF401 family protein [Thermoplasmatota archaeon]
MIQWIGFLIAMMVILVGARYHLTLALLTGSLILGLFTLTLRGVVEQAYVTLTTLDTVVLIFALGMIPIIGGILQESGKLNDIINNLRVGKRPFLGSTPALLGLLPIPGGALFSAPLIDKAGDDLDGHVKTGINVWFRHVLYFIYPISYALFVSADIANLSVYKIILFQIPFFLLTVFLGYFFLLRKVKGEMNYDKDFDLDALLPPLAVLLTAPILHFILSEIFFFEIENLSVFIAIAVSLTLAVFIVEESKIKIIKKSIKEMRPWNFMVLIFSLYFFINVFRSSGIGELIENLSLPPIVLIVGFGFILGIATGRIILPASIIIPIYMSTYGFETLPLIVFSMLYVSIFMGYVITPVHPCISISLEYFDGKMDKFLKLMAGPVVISLVIVSIIFLLFV